jgi:hypothetical protein
MSEGQRWAAILVRPAVKAVAAVVEELPTFNVDASVDSSMNCRMNDPHAQPPPLF